MTPDSVQDWPQTSDSSTTTTNLEPCNPYSSLIQCNPISNNQAHTQNQHQAWQSNRQATLYDWIKPHLPDTATNTNPSTNKINMNPTNNNKPATKKHQQHKLHRHHQQLITQYTDNDHWGDPLSPSQHIFCIALKNVNTISPNDNLLQWRGVADDMASLRINSFAIQEPNTKWNEHLTQCIQQIFQQTFRQSTLSTSNSTELTNNTYQPGGTVVTVVGPHASQMISSGQDDSGMG